MDYILGIGEYGSCELFGSTTVCALHIPLLMAPTLTTKFLGYLNHAADDYDSFRVVKGLFPNYGDTNMADYLAHSHYYDTTLSDDAYFGIVNTMADTFDPRSKNHIVAYVHSTGVERLNDIMSEYGSMGGCMYSIITHAIEELEDELESITSGIKSEKTGDFDMELHLDGDGYDPEWQFVANWLANMIARAGYLSQIQQLELQCKASLPRGVSKEANDFYLNRCIHMTPEDKKKLFKVYLMERRR